MNFIYDLITIPYINPTDGSVGEEREQRVAGFVDVTLQDTCC